MSKDPAATSISDAHPRVFLGLTEVSGYYAQLRKGFLELGIKCVHIPLQGHRFAYEEASDLGWPARLARHFVVKRASLSERSRIARALWLVPVLVTRAILFIWAISRFDVFILGGGSSFFRFWDLPVLRLLGRRVVYVLHGTDARPAYLDGNFYQERHALDRQHANTHPLVDDELIDACVAATRTRRRDVAWIERYANIVVCGPGFAQLLEQPFVNFASIGIPFAAPPRLSVGARPPDGRVRILHATSDTIGRGTHLTEKMIQGLVERGLPIDFVLITGQPHQVVLQELNICDFVIDGQWADTPMAGFGTEAASFGKPVVMGGYYADNVSRDMPADTIPPTCFTLPEQMQESVERLVESASYRTELGERLRTFVKENLTPKNVAKKYLCLLSGDVPKSWWNSTHDNPYYLGGGMPASRISKIVQAIVQRHGTGGLSLDHNPELRQMLLDFVGKISDSPVPCAEHRIG